MTDLYISNYGKLSILESKDSIISYDQNSKKWLSMNKNLEEILLLCQGGLTLEQIIKQISRDHLISEDEIMDKVLTPILSLKKDGLVFEREEKEDKPIRLKEYKFEFPLISAFVEITKRCNLKCSHCYNESSKDQEDELPRANLSNFLNQADQIGVFNIFLTGGEPFVRRDFIDILYEIKERGMETGILTNGTLLNKGIIKKLAELNPKFLAVSLESINPEKYWKIRGIDNSIVIKNILEMKEQRINVKINNVLFNGLNDSYEDIKELLIFLKKNGFSRGDIAFDEVLDIGRGKSLQDYLIQNKSSVVKDYKRAFKDIFQEEVANKPTYGDSIRTSFCGLGEGILYLTSRADLTLCTILTDERFKAGNIREKTLREIWEKSDKFNYFRRKEHIKNSECEDCSKLTECAGGCKAKSILLEEDFNKPDRWACKFYF